MKNLTVVGKFLTLTATLISVSGCVGHTVNQSASVKNSVTGPYRATTGAYDMSWQFIQNYHYRLTDQQKMKQTSAVYSALESEYGVVHKWFAGDAFGAAKAVHGYPAR